MVKDERLEGEGGGLKAQAVCKRRQKLRVRSEREAATMDSRTWVSLRLVERLKPLIKFEL
jgi:hypothetical protein